MPRNYNEREEQDRGARHGIGSSTRSPKRRKRSRSRDIEHSSDRHVSPALENTKRKERDCGQNRQTTNRSHRLEEGRWGNNSSNSSESDEDRENMKVKREENSRGRMKSDHEEKYKGRETESLDNRRGFDTMEKINQTDTTGRINVKGQEEEEKQGPNMALSGKLMEDTNVFNGVTVKYSEPPEAKKPKKRWRFYVFKGTEAMPVLHLHRQSAYLLGKDRKVADIPIDHPSCSRQHAVLQYRCIPGSTVDGQKVSRVLPYIIDLESSNGTFVNNKKIEPKRYLELREKDVLKFGFSSREYVLLHDQSDHGSEDE